VAAGSEFERPAPGGGTGTGTVYMLICALDYKNTPYPLTCSLDGQNMYELARQCGVQNVTCMWNEQCTKEAVIARIKLIGSRVGPDDYFIFYYAGHGEGVQCGHGHSDERDGVDEAFVFVDQYGQIDPDRTFLLDDEFSEVLSASLRSKGVRVLIITDCCHSDTIADLESDVWCDQEVLSIAGCKDFQTSGDTGQGGIFTHSMLLAIERLQHEGEESYSAGLLFNTTIEFQRLVFDGAQNISLEHTRNIGTDGLAWPLVPLYEYMSPLTRAQRMGMPPPMRKSSGPARPANAAGTQDEEECDDEGDITKVTPEQAAEANVSPKILQLIKGRIDMDDVDINTLKK